MHKLYIDNRFNGDQMGVIIICSKSKHQIEDKAISNKTVKSYLYLSLYFASDTCKLLKHAVCHYLFKAKMCLTI